MTHWIPFAVKKRSLTWRDVVQKNIFEWVLQWHFSLSLTNRSTWPPPILSTPLVSQVLFRYAPSLIPLLLWDYINSKWPNSYLAEEEDKSQQGPLSKVPTQAAKQQRAKLGRFLPTQVSEDARCSLFLYEVPFKCHAPYLGESQIRHENKDKEGGR